MSRKLSALELRVWQLEQKVRSLEAELNLSDTIPNEPDNIRNEQPHISYQRVLPTGPEPVSIPKTKPSSKKIDLEGRMGKQVMGVVASLLIFVGLCSLAVLVYPYLEKETKFAIMYILSFAVLTTGLLLQKKLHNYFSISLIGCGVGMVYISFLLSRLYFHYINDYVLYGLFFLWVVGMVYLSKRLRIILFHIIGYVGIGVSVIFGATMAIAWQEIIFLNIFQLMCILAYMFTKTEKPGINLTCLGGLSVILSSVQYMTLSDYWLQTTDSIQMHLLFCLSTILLILPIIIIFINILRTMGKGLLKTVWLVIQYLVSGILIYNGGELLSTRLGLEDPYSIGFACVFVLWLPLFILYERREKGIVCKSILFSLLAVVYLAYVFEDYAYLDSINEVIGVLPFAVAALLIAWKRKDKVYACVGIIMTYLNTFLTASSPEFGFLYGWLPEIFIIGSLSFIFIIMAKWDFLQKTGWKLSAYLLLISSIFTFVYDADYKDALALAVLVMGIIHLAILNSGFACRWEKLKDIAIRKGEENRILLGVCQIMSEIFLVIILFTLYDVQQIWLHWILVLLAASYCAVNMLVYLKRQKVKEWMGYIYGLRITATTLGIIFSFISWSEYELAGSVITLCLALVFIICGFRIKQKTLRLYGLFLTMVCVLKLLLIDISYENSIMRVIGFIGAGIICFAISWLYNRANRKLKN